MIKYKIQTRDKFLVMDDLPHNCIFNKVVTGCGATTIAIENDENYIIAVPTTEIIENKCFPPQDKEGNINNWKNGQKKPGESPVKNLFGLYGDSNLLLKQKLKAYLAKEGTKKIICTYDKIPYLLGFINPNDFRLLVDEYHSFLKSYSYREKAINGVLDNYKKFKSYCFLSATPIHVDFKPDALLDVPEYIADWNDVDKIIVFPYKTDKPYMIAAKIIKEYQNNGYIEIDDDKSYEAYFFINSVTEIKKILEQSQLTNEECRIICADNPRNRTTLKDYNISSSTDRPKKFNFITSKSFEGVDYYSETGICFVVSNVYNNHTLLSIDMDIPQIVGRIRTKTNPHRNKIIHIFNTRPNDLYATYDEIKLDVEKQIQLAAERADLYNVYLTDDAKEQQKKEIDNENSYLRYDKENDKFIVNDMFSKMRLYDYKISNMVYSSGSSLKQEYENTGINASSIIWEKAPDNYVKSLFTPPSFRDTLKRYIKLRQEHPLLIGETQRIEERYPILPKAYSLLGAEKLRRLRSIKAINIILKKFN